MRTRTGAAALALTAVAGCSTGDRPPAGDAAPSTPAPRTPATATPAPGHDDPPATRPPVRSGGGDVDGDGRPDRIAVVEDGDRSRDGWRWGLRVAMTTAGTRTYWGDCCANEAQELGPVGDVDGDGDDEVAVSPGGTAGSRGWLLLTFADGALKPVRGVELITGDVGDAHAHELTTWSCVPGGIVVATVAEHATSGTRRYYRMTGTRLVRTRLVRDDWTGSGRRPKEYDAFDC